MSEIAIGNIINEKSASNAENFSFVVVGTPIIVFRRSLFEYNNPLEKYMLAIVSTIVILDEKYRYEMVPEVIPSIAPNIQCLT